MYVSSVVEKMEVISGQHGVGDDEGKNKKKVPLLPRTLENGYPIGLSGPYKSRSRRVNWTTRPGLEEICRPQFRGLPSLLVTEGLKTFNCFNDI